MMERVQQLFRNDSVTYEPIEGGSETPEGDRIEHPAHPSFSWIDYCVFGLLGISMLWAW